MCFFDNHCGFGHRNLCYSQIGARLILIRCIGWIIKCKIILLFIYIQLVTLYGPIAGGKVPAPFPSKARVLTDVGGAFVFDQSR